MIEETDHAWAAGFLDGEGCFDSRPNNGGLSYTSRITASQVVREPLDRLADLFGGPVRWVAQSGRYGVWQWRIEQRGQILACIDAICPYLIVKKRQADLLRESTAMIGSRKGPQHRSLEERALRSERWAQLAVELKKEKVVHRGCAA